MSTAFKKLINTVSRCVDDNLEGLVAVNPGLRLLQGHRVVVRSDIAEVIKAGHVTVLCGGGSGHEPAHAGYIGEGGLDAAVPGSVFTSPPPRSILAAIRTITDGSSAGCIVIVANYIGDRINFGLALERARQEGRKVHMVLVGEDCALESCDKTAGRRGLAGVILTIKICGALAKEGRSVEEIARIAQDATTKMGTIGLSLTPCSIPGAGPSFEIGDDEMELGLGVHGEAGVKRLKVVGAKEAVQLMIDHMTNPKTSTHFDVKKVDRVACMINNLGGTSILEMNIIARETITLLEERGIVVERAYNGSFVTSLQMAGISITLLHLDDTLRKCLDASTLAPGWQCPLLPPGVTVRQTPPTMAVKHVDETKSKSETKDVLNSDERNAMYDIIKAVAESLIAAETELNNLDKESGDGDCGSTMARGSKLLLEQLGARESPGLPVGHPSELSTCLASIAENEMGGSSGGFYSLFFTAAANILLQSVSAQSWCEALHVGMQTMMKYGGAEPGDRTMLDPLHAAYTTLSDELRNNKEPVAAFKVAVQSADTVAKSTANMAAKAGRASYVSVDHLNHPDPGAIAVTIWMKAILSVLEK